MGAVKPYYQDGSVQVFWGDCREILPALDLTFDAAIVDPPYQETSLAWDRWPDGWPSVVAEATSSLWCWGSMRSHLDRAGDLALAGWRLSHDVVGEWEVDTAVWEKHNGTGFAADRLRRVHELATHWYRGRWADVYHHVPRVPAVFDPKGKPPVSTSVAPVGHTGAIGPHVYINDGLRLARSVIRAPSIRRGLHHTQKPVEVLAPLIEYAVPLGGLLLDPMAGSGSTAVAARQLGRRCVLIEADEHYCETTARRLDQGLLLPTGGEHRG